MTDDLLLVRERLLDHLAGPPPFESNQDGAPDPEAQAAGLALLDDPRLLDRVAQTVTALGWTPPPGEEHLPKVLYLAFTSRLLPCPVNAAVEGPNGAGEPCLMRTLALLLPADAIMALTGMSERALFYLDVDRPATQGAQRQRSGRAAPRRDRRRHHAERRLGRARRLSHCREDPGWPAREPYP